MALHITGMSASGPRNWVIQRMSALVIGTYSVLLAKFILTHSANYLSWLMFMTSPWMRVMNILALIALCAHSWIGVWTIHMDYVKSPWLRLTLQSVLPLLCLGYLVWGGWIFWSVK